MRLLLVNRWHCLAESCLTAGSRGVARAPSLQVCRPRMARYREISAQVFAIFRVFTPLVEGLSLDEAFLDVTACRRLLGEPGAIGSAIRGRIRADIDLPASVGIGPRSE